MIYDNLEYAKKRLEQTVVLDVKNNPVYVEQVTEDWRFKVLNIVKGTRKVLEKEDVTLTPPRLGFANIVNEAIFFCRKPMRKDWRQGLSKNSLYSAKWKDGTLFPLSFKDMFMGVYPSYEESYDRCKWDNGASCAFSRDFAINNTTLFYRFDEVGIVSGKVPVLLDKYNYLQQNLDYEMSKNAS